MMIQSELPRLLDELCFDVEYSHKSQRVWFGDVEVLQFSYTIGDHPSVTNGCPVTMGHELVAKQSYRLTNYERHHRRQKRSRKEMRLPAEKRSQILSDAGIPAHAIMERTFEVLQERERRSKTSRNQRCELLYERLLLLQGQQHKADDTTKQSKLRKNTQAAATTSQRAIKAQNYSNWGGRIFNKLMLN